MPGQSRGDGHFSASQTFNYRPAVFRKALDAVDAMSTRTRNGALVVVHPDRPQETMPMRWSSAADAPLLITGPAQGTPDTCQLRPSTCTDGGSATVLTRYT